MSSASVPHSLLSLGNLVSGIMDVIEEIKSDMEEIKSGTPKLLTLRMRLTSAPLKQASSLFADGALCQSI